MSKTPRTDAVSVPVHALKLPRFPNGDYDKSTRLVLASEMEKLERELNEAKAKLDACVQADPRQLWSLATMEMAKKRDQWRECARGLAERLQKIGDSVQLYDSEEEALAKFDELEKENQ